MEEDARELLKQVQMRKSTFEYNLNLLERRRKLRDVCGYVDSLVSSIDSPNVERLRARRLIHEKLRQAEVDVLKNLTEIRQKIEETRKQSETVSKSRLYRNKNHDCERCAKTEVRSRTQSNPIGITKSRRQTNIGKPTKTNGKNDAPRKERVTFGRSVVVLDRPSQNPMISTHRLQAKQLAQSLKDKLRESSSLEHDRRAIIPLGFCQKNVVSQSTKSTNTFPLDCDEQVSIETVVRDGEESGGKAPRSLSVRVLPGVNVPGASVVSLPLVKPHSTYKYVEVFDSKDVANANEELNSVQVNRFPHNFGVFRPVSPESEPYLVEPLFDETRNPFADARQWLERELVEYVLSRISLDESRQESEAKSIEENERMTFEIADVAQSLNVSKKVDQSLSEEISESCSSSSSISVPWIPSPDGTQTQQSMESGIPNPEPTPLDVEELPKDEDEQDSRVLESSEAALMPQSPFPANLNPEEIRLIEETNDSNNPALVSVELYSSSSVKEIKDQSENTNDVSMNNTSPDPVTDSKDTTAVSQSLQDISIGQVIPIRQLRNVAYNRQRRQWSSITKKRSVLETSATSTLDRTEELSITDPSSTVLSKGEVRIICGTGDHSSTVLWHHLGPRKNFFVSSGNSETRRQESADKSLGEVSCGRIQSTSYQEEMFDDSLSRDVELSKETTDPLSEGEVGQR